jgi:predicted deacylase
VSSVRTKWDPAVGEALLGKGRERFENPSPIKHLPAGKRLKVIVGVLEAAAAQGDVPAAKAVVSYEQWRTEMRKGKAPQAHRVELGGHVTVKADAISVASAAVLAVLALSGAAIEEAPEAKALFPAPSCDSESGPGEQTTANAGDAAAASDNGDYVALSAGGKPGPTARGRAPRPGVVPRTSTRKRGGQAASGKRNPA